MDKQIYLYKKILDQFNCIPVKDRQKSFMEICKYPGCRFEEVCSRILRFFFDPNEVHRMSDLWITSLFSALGQEYNPLQNKVLRTSVEEYAFGKRIDLLIDCEDSVIAIENKILAALYNPLDIYSEYLKTIAPKKNHVKIVLALKPMKDVRSLKLMKDNGFYFLTYRDLFDHIKKNLGSYLSYCQQNFVTQLFDFINTIENMENSNSKIETDFFYENKEIIERLIEQYNVFKNNIWDEQCRNISMLEQRISECTGEKWWVYQDWDLGTEFNFKNSRIGIESSYEDFLRNPCGKFHIYITTWNKEDWNPYKNIILEKFPNNILLDENNPKRVYLHLPIIQGNDHDQIISALSNAYEILRELEREINSEG